MAGKEQLKFKSRSRQIDQQQRIEAVRDEWTAAERVARLWQAAQRQRELAELMGLVPSGDRPPSRKSYHCCG
jgi:hypothetical protein